MEYFMLAFFVVVIGYHFYHSSAENKKNKEALFKKTGFDVSNVSALDFRNIAHCVDFKDIELYLNAYSDDDQIETGDKEDTHLIGDEGWKFSSAEYTFNSDGLSEDEKNLISNKIKILSEHNLINYLLNVNTMASILETRHSDFDGKKQFFQKYYFSDSFKTYFKNYNVIPDELPCDSLIFFFSGDIYTVRICRNRKKSLFYENKIRKELILYCNGDPILECEWDDEPTRTEEILVTRLLVDEQALTGLEQRFSLLNALSLRYRNEDIQKSNQHKEEERLRKIEDKKSSFGLDN